MLSVISQMFSLALLKAVPNFCVRSVARLILWKTVTASSSNIAGDGGKNDSRFSHRPQKPHADPLYRRIQEDHGHAVRSVNCSEKRKLKWWKGTCSAVLLSGYTVAVSEVKEKQNAAKLSK